MVDSFPEPRLIFSHSNYKFLASKLKKTNNKIIYCLRNPKDALVSMMYVYNTFYKHSTLSLLGREATLEETLEFYCSPRADNGSYFDQVLPWWEHRNDHQILFVYYEDTLRDPENTVRKIAQFLEKDLTDEQVKTILDATTITSMKKTYAEVPMPESLKNFNLGGGIRKGGVGGWKNYFTVAQNEWMDDLIEKHFAGTGLKFTYE